MPRVAIALLAIIMLVSATSQSPVKKQRIGAIKEEIGNLTGQLIELTNDQMAKITVLMKTSICDMRELVEGENNSFFALAEREELEKYRDQLKESVGLAKECIEKMVYSQKSLEKIKHSSKKIIIE